MPTTDIFRTAPPTLQRRCPLCSAAVASVNGHRVCADPACLCARSQAWTPRCPRCLGMARVNDEVLTCLAGCPDLSLAAPHRSGWESALRGQLAADYEAQWGDPWGLAGMHTVAWDRYSDPESRLQRRWGTHGDEGTEIRSVEGRALAMQHLEDVNRIAEMSNALRAFGAYVRADTGIQLRGNSHREAPSFIGCLGAAYAAETRPLDAATGHAVRDAMAAFWADDTARSWMVREVGVAAVIELHRAIVMRGGSYGGVSTLLRQMAGVRDTPFGGYRHAVAFYFGDRSSTTLGAGNGLASMLGADLPAPLPGGMRFDEIAVNPSRNRGHDPRNANAWVMLQDVVGCFAAARVGGVWVPPDDDSPGAAGEAWTCDGGRPLAPWELHMVRMCDYGVDVAPERRKGRKGKPADGNGSSHANGSAGGADEDYWRRLTVTEAVEQVKQAAVQRVEDPAWGPARHISNEDGRRALRAARRALREALEAWGLTPRHEAPARRKGPPRGQDEPPRDAAPVPVWERAINTWDPEAPR